MMNITRKLGSTAMDSLTAQLLWTVCHDDDDLVGYAMDAMVASVADGWIRGHRNGEATDDRLGRAYRLRRVIRKRVMTTAQNRRALLRAYSRGEEYDPGAYDDSADPAEPEELPF